MGARVARLKYALEGVAGPIAVIDVQECTLTPALVHAEEGRRATTEPSAFFQFLAIDAGRNACPP
jgi:hypothetical protein